MARNVSARITGIAEDARNFCRVFGWSHRPDGLTPLIRNEMDGSLLALVPAGEFEMGDGNHETCPKHTVYLDAYYLGVYCVTNRQYGEFVRETGHRPPNESSYSGGTPIWRGSSYPPEKADHPVLCVSWDDAQAYCKWAGLELPSEAQWEKGARGPAGLLYPWGNEWDGNRCQHAVGKNADGPCAVGRHPGGVSGYETYQQSGNVWEWCRDWFDGGYYDKSPQSNPDGPSSGSSRVIRGGSWNDDDAELFRCTSRYNYGPSYRFANLGFRVALMP